MYEGAAEGRLRTKIHSIVIMAIDAKGCPSLGKKRGDARFRPSALSHRQTVNTVIHRWACCRAQTQKPLYTGHVIPISCWPAIISGIAPPRPWQTRHCARPSV
jgi:hypothetical protein